MRGDAEVATKDRIVLLDALRGLAILGILLCNIPLVFQPEMVAESIPFWPLGDGLATVSVWWLTQVFFQQKFYTLFGLLFGASVLLVGGEGGKGGGRQRTTMIVRRLLALLVIGLFHGFVIWQGDVLWTYALVGLLVLPVRGWSSRRLLTTGVLVHLGVNGWQLWRLFSRALQGDKPMPPAALAHLARETKTIADHFTGGFTSSLAQNAKGYWEFVGHTWSLAPTWPLIVLGLLLAGMGLFKSGLLKGEASPTVYKALVAIGAAAMALTAVLLSLYAIAPMQPGVMGRLSHWMQSVTAPAVSLGYLGLLALAADARGWRALSAVLAPVGQMAFTNYIAQSVIMTGLSYGGRGPVLYGKLDRPALLAITIAIWTAQILWSHWWLKRFTMGPLEWLWRLAYRGRTPLRRLSPPSTSPAARRA